jgi:hypothetical protein
MGVVLQVENLSAQVTDDDLIVRFGDFAIAESATVDRSSAAIFDQSSACVVMANDEEAQAAIDWLHDTQFKGRTIFVTRALADRERVS